MRYHPKPRKSCLETKRMSQWTTTSAEKKDTTVPTASPGRLAATSCSRACQRSQTVAPKIVRIARKKENSVAALRESPKMRPPMIVAPERLDLERVLPVHVVHLLHARLDAELLMTMLDIEDDEAADDQRRRHGERIEEIGLEKIRDKNADDGSGEEGHERIDDETLLDGLRKETTEDPDDPHPVVPTDRKDCTRLNGDDERV